MHQNVRRPRKASLETEVITATVSLYLFIALVMATVHHLQPGGQLTRSSSTAPAHESFSALPADARPVGAPRP